MKLSIPRYKAPACKEYRMPQPQTTKGLPETDDLFVGLVQERRNSSALAMELRLSCTKPSYYWAETHPYV